MRHLKLAVRTLAKTPFITGIAVLSLALGIGANAAIFSLFDQVLLRPLPVHEPERLVNLASPGPKPGSQSCNQAGDCDHVFSYPMFRDLERETSAFAGLAAHRAFGANLAHRNRTTDGEGMLVSGSYFPLLGITPALGRLLGPSDDQTVDGHEVAVLSHRFWANNLGEDPGVVGETMVINGRPMTVVGVAPRGFDGTTLGSRPDVFVPLTMRGAVEPGFEGFENRRSYWVYVFGRLAPGVSPERAHADVNRVYGTLVNEVEAPLQEGMSEQRMAEFRAKQVTMEDGRRGQSTVHGEARVPLILLIGITGVVLLIACANIANLLLARGATRAPEMAIRGALGAGRGRLLGQLLTESLLLALAGGVASLLVAGWTLSTIGSLLPPEALATLRLELDPSVVAFTAALSIGTGLLFGMYPALNATRPDLVTALRSSSGQPSGGRAAARFRTSLVTAQIALSMTLLVAAGLFLKSLVNVARVDLGFQTANVVTFAVSPQLNGYDQARTRELLARIEEELAALPGVTSVSSALVPVLSGSSWGNDVSVEGFERGPDIDANSRFNAVGPGYFRTLGVPVRAGRELTPADGEGATKVAVVNEAFARKFGLDGPSAVGKRMATGQPDELDTEIIGLVADARYNDVKQEPPPLYYVPYRQMERAYGMTFYARTAVDPRQVMPSVRSLVERIDPNLPVEDLKTLEQQARESVFLDRMIGTLSAAFALLATLLAAVGLYGVLAYSVAQRTREIGLRMALGAESSRVQRMVLGQVLGMTLVGGLVGVAGALALGRAARSLLFGLEGHDPWVVVATGVLLGAVALAAGYAPALRASRVDPMQALRYE